MTPRAHASIIVVCSEFVIVPDTSCITVSGPPNASVTFADFGTYLEARRFLVNWTASDGYEGAVNIGLNQCVPLFLVSLFLYFPCFCIFLVFMCLLCDAPSI